MPLPTVYWLVEVSKILGKALPFFGSVVGFITLVYDLGEKMLVGGLNFFISQLNTIDTSMFSNASFASVAGIGYCNAVFPLSEAIAIWTALGACFVTILILRWVKSFIPTVAN